MSARVSFEQALAESAQFVEDSLDALLPAVAGPEARVLEAMRYAALGGGKRLRGFLVVQTANLFGVDRRAVGRVAAAVECIHAYSLVHDDLPAMDDDDLRRGKPTVHKAFDEATAILAGDALLTHAFALLGSPEAHGDPFVRCELVVRLAQAAGHAGMVGGQMMDMAFEGQTPSMAEITRLQRMKTAALICFSSEAGATLGKASQPMRNALAAFGQELGLAFQIELLRIGMMGAFPQQLACQGLRRRAVRQPHRQRHGVMHQRRVIRHAIDEPPGMGFFGGQPVPQQRKFARPRHRRPSAGRKEAEPADRRVAWPARHQGVRPDRPGREPHRGKAADGGNRQGAVL